MMEKTGGPAYPTTQYTNGISPTGHDYGMTLRDYFAAKAMQGLMDAGMPMQEIAKEAYDMADAMLEARK